MRSLIKKKKKNLLAVLDVVVRCMMPDETPLRESRNDPTEYWLSSHSIQRKFSILPVREAFANYLGHIAWN
jgi:hypothetical protein